MVPTCPPFDVPSVFGRDISKFKDFMSSWYGRAVTPMAAKSKSWSIVFPTDYMNIQNEEQLRHIEKFTDDLAKFLDTEVQRISISQRWKETTTTNQSMDDYMSWVSRASL